MAPISASAPSKRNTFLLLALFVSVVLFLALLPWLRRINEETARLEHQAEQNQKSASELSGKRQQLDAARLAVTQTPNDPIAHLRLAGMLTETGALDEARSHVELSLRLRPGEVGALLLLADIHQRARQHYEAMNAYRGALARSPLDPRALTGLGWLYVSFGWTREARALLEPAVTALPDDPRLRVTLTMAYIQHNEYGKAEQQLLEVRRLAPKDVSLWSPLADLYNKARESKKAITAANDALALMPEDPRLLNELAQACFDSGDIAGAEANARKVLAVVPEDLRARYRLALCYQRTNRAAEMQRELETIFQRAPGYEMTRLLLGQTYLKQNRAAEGRKLLAEYRKEEAAAHKRARVGYLLSTKLNDAEAHWRMALLYQEDRNRPRLLMELHKTLEIAPNHAGAKRLLAETLAAPDRAGS